MTEAEAFRRRRAAASTAACAPSAMQCVARLPGRRRSTSTCAARSSRSRSAPSVVATGFRLFPADAQAAVRLRPLQERDHRHADGPPAGPDTTLQHRAAARRRQGARPHRLRDVHRFARRDRRQPAVLEDLLHVLAQAEPAHHGRPAARRRDRATTSTSVRPARATTSSTSRPRTWARTSSRAASPGITETDNGNLVLRYEDIENGGALAEAEYDLVVLAVGVQPNREAAVLFARRRAGPRRAPLRRRGRRGPEPGPHQHPRRLRRRLGRFGATGHPRLDPPRRVPRSPRPPPTSSASGARHSRKVPA